jgi:hypothetical protein
VCFTKLQRMADSSAAATDDEAMGEGKADQLPAVADPAKHMSHYFYFDMRQTTLELKTRIGQIIECDVSNFNLFTAPTKNAASRGGLLLTQQARPAYPLKKLRASFPKWPYYRLRCCLSLHSQALTLCGQAETFALGRACPQAHISGSHRRGGCVWRACGGRVRACVRAHQSATRYLVRVRAMEGPAVSTEESTRCLAIYWHAPGRPRVPLFHDRVHTEESLEAFKDGLLSRLLENAPRLLHAVYTPEPIDSHASAFSCTMLLQRGGV